MQKVRKAVIPAAGYGTRLLPITKTVSKEILPVVDKPIIQMVVEELVDAGITDIIIVTSSRKADLVNYFGDIDQGLANHLWGAGPQKAAILDSLEKIKKLANFAFVEQQWGYGTGMPVLFAEPYLGGEPFIYTWADDFYVGENSYRQMIDAYEKYNAPVCGGQKRSSDEDYARYGFVGGHELEPGIVEVQHIKEHPKREEAPGDLALLGGFVVTPEVLQYLHIAKDQVEAGKELYFHSALSMMMQDGKRVVGKYIENSQYYDTGNKMEYMKTVVSIAANHPEIGPGFRQFLEDFTRRMHER